MTGNGYEVEPADLQLAASGINGVITELRDLGIVGTGDVGRGFSNMDLSGMDLGHAGLKSATDDFMSRWAWGVRSLVQDGNEIGLRLDLNAGAYALMEQYVDDSFKTMAVNAAGDPGMSGEEAAQMSWGDIGEHMTSSDYSPDSFGDSFDRMGDTWGETWDGMQEDVAQRPWRPVTGPVGDLFPPLGGQ